MAQLARSRSLLRSEISRLYADVEPTIASAISHILLEASGGGGVGGGGGGGGGGWSKTHMHPN